MQSIQLKKIYSTVPSAFANGYNQVYWDMMLEFTEPTEVIKSDNTTRAVVAPGLYLVKRFVWCPAAANVELDSLTPNSKRGLWMCIRTGYLGDFLMFLEYASQIVILERV